MAAFSFFRHELPAALAAQTACAPCHPGIYKNYASAGMGRSFFRPRPENTIEDYRNRNSYFHPASNTWYEMVERGGAYYQRRYQKNGAGAEINTDEKSIDFVMGSGNHARTYLHRTRRSRSASSFLVRGKWRLLGDEPGL